MMHYKCLICAKLAQNPVQTINGHRFCQQCFMLKCGKTERCLLCVQDHISQEMDCFKLGMDKVFRDRGAEMDMKKFPAECRQCGCQALYHEIVKLHIEEPCTRPSCCPCQCIQKAQEMLSSAFHSIMNRF